jgi:hypothetical protein
MTRADLLALTDDTLATIANRGLVKRALREYQNEPPTVTFSADAIIASFADGAETVLPAGAPFTDASCTCGANAVCRHRIGLVIAVRYSAEGSGKDEVVWTPGEFDDRALIEHLGATVVARAKRTRARGYQATVHRTRGSNPVVRVELPHCTVRFLVPHEISHAYSSATDHVTGESIALAVWAVQVSDDSGDDRVHVGPKPLLRVVDHATTARNLARTILLDGVASTTAVQVASAIRSSATIDAGPAVWLADACTDLTDQLQAYLGRHARHSRSHVAGLVAEIHARTRLGSSDDSSTAAAALGTDTPGETPLRRTRLVSLGARVSGMAESITSDVFFADADSSSVFVVRHEWKGETGKHLTGFDIAERRVFGTNLGSLASSTVVTESAVRRANHRIRLARRGIGKTSVLPLGRTGWANATGLVDDYADLHRTLSARTPSFARERVVTDGVALLRIDDIIGSDYSPADQTLVVTVADPFGSIARIAVEHRACTPGAIDATIRAMATHPTVVTGRVHVRAGTLQVLPFAIACDDGIVVPDFESEGVPSTLVRSEPPPADPIDDALDDALSTLADLSHRGLRHVAGDGASALRERANRLTAVGMTTSARSMERAADVLLAADVDRAGDAWVDAAVRIVTATEAR